MMRRVLLAPTGMISCRIYSLVTAGERFDRLGEIFTESTDD